MLPIPCLYWQVAIFKCTSHATLYHTVMFHLELPKRMSLQTLSGQAPCSGTATSSWEAYFHGSIRDVALLYLSAAARCCRHQSEHPFDSRTCIYIFICIVERIEFCRFWGTHVANKQNIMLEPDYQRGVKMTHVFTAPFRVCR